MSKKMSTVIRAFVSLTLLFLILFSVFNVCDYILISKSEMVENISKPMKLYGVEKCFYDDKFIYVTDSNRGMVQIFEPSGAFKNCVSLPTHGGVVWVGMNNNALYCYCVRLQTLFVFRDGEILNQSKNHYINSNDFYASNNLITDNSLVLKKNIVKIGDKNVLLETSSSCFSIVVYSVLFFTSFASFLFVSGLMKRLKSIKQY